MTQCPGDRRYWLALVTVLALILPSRGPSYAESSSAPAVKAAFLYNFSKFAEWPVDALAPGQRLSLCVIGENAVADALQQIIGGHTVDGHELTVQVLKVDGPIRSCHVLFVSGLDARQSAQLLLALTGAPVFTVSDAKGFAESGGVAELVTENDRMRFVVNLGSAQRARLNLSAKLLSLARIVKGERDVQR